MSNHHKHTFFITLVIHTAFGCYVQSVLKNNQVIRTHPLKSLQCLQGDTSQMQATASAHTEIIDSHPLLAIHCCPKESDRIGLFHTPFHLSDSPLHREHLQSVVPRLFMQHICSPVYLRTNTGKSLVQVIESRHLTCIQMRSILGLPFQLHVCSLTSKKVMPGNILQTSVKTYRIIARMTAPTTKRVTNSGAIATNRASYGHITYSTPSKFTLKPFAQISREDICFDKRITEIGNTNRTFHCPDGRKRFIKMLHSPHSRIRIVFYAGHSRFASIYKNRLYGRRKNNGIRIRHFLHIRTDIGQQVNFAKLFTIQFHRRKKIQPQ